MIFHKDLFFCSDYFVKYYKKEIHEDNQIKGKVFLCTTVDVGVVFVVWCTDAVCEDLSDD